MSTFYLWCVLLGFAIPILSLTLGGLSSWFDIDFDLDGDIDSAAFVGFNLTCLCFGLAIGGIVGRYCLESMALWAGFLLALASGVVAYVLLYVYVFAPLKRNRSFAMSEDEMVGKHCRVLDRVSSDPEHPGVITFLDSTGATISYPALVKEGPDIEQGEEAEIVDFIKERLICIIVRKRGSSQCRRCQE